MNTKKTVELNIDQRLNGLNTEQGCSLSHMPLIPCLLCALMIFKE